MRHWRTGRSATCRGVLRSPIQLGCNRYRHRKYYCKSDDACSSREWVEIRDDGVEQDWHLDVTREWEYAGTRPSGYTTSTP